MSLEVNPRVFRVKDNGTWTPVLALKGDTGATGPQGPQGPQGTGVPSGGNTGDILVKTASGTAWQPLPVWDGGNS